MSGITSNALAYKLTESHIPVQENRSYQRISQPTPEVQYAPIVVRKQEDINTSINKIAGGIFTVVSILGFTGGGVSLLAGLILSGSGDVDSGNKALIGAGVSIGVGFITGVCTIISICSEKLRGKSN